MRLRSSGNSPSHEPNATMAEGVGSSVPGGLGAHNVVMHHKVLTQPVNVTLFKGRIKGAPCDVESYITAVEAHLSSKGVTDEVTSYSEALTFMDLSPDCDGDIRSFILSFDNQGVKTWTGLKAKLRDVYRSLGSDDAVANMARILRKGNEDNSDYLKYGPTCFTRLQEWKEVVRRSPWVQDGMLSVDHVAELLGTAHMLSRLPESLVNGFLHRWKPGDGMARIDKLVQEGKIKNPNLDHSLLGTVAVVNKPQREGNRNYSHPDRQRSRSEYTCRWPGVVCYNCQKKGHIQRECRSPSFCTFHGVANHRTDECRSRERHRSPSRNHWRRDRSRSRSRSRHHNSWNQANRGQQSQNFQEGEIIPLQG